MKIYIQKNNQQGIYRAYVFCAGESIHIASGVSNEHAVKILKEEINKGLPDGMEVILEEYHEK